MKRCLGHYCSKHCNGNSLILFRCTLEAKTVPGYSIKTREARKSKKNNKKESGSSRRNKTQLGGGRRRTYSGEPCQYIYIYIRHVQRHSTVSREKRKKNWGVGKRGDGGGGRKSVKQVGKFVIHNHI